MQDTEGTLTLSGKDPSPFRAVPTIGGDNGRHVGECLESGGRTKLNKIELNGNQGELPRRARYSQSVSSSSCTHPFAIHIHKPTIPTTNTTGQRPLGWCQWHHFRHCSTNLPLTADVALKERTKRRR
ncbi:hypothetical protein ACH3XW_23065 [Acanthocheilonema viteae]